MFLFSLLINFTSLVLVVTFLKKPLRLIINNPAFLVGDFIIIPSYFSLLNLKALTFRTDLFLLSISLVFFWGYKFKLIKPVWFFHGIVAVGVVYTYLFTLFTGDTASLTILSFLLALHQLLGVIWQKKIG